ncbi:MAG: hypothetical protein KIT80_22985 [Chitinophagaceae bacterium]|nr:hypothetical protein [Chitinophagaceae bacterium]MCW5929804.1 hypothetical protein [Chitinophagaceae bacterium]
MKKVICFLSGLILLLSSCANKTVRNYEQLVDRADKIVIGRLGQYDSIVITNAAVLQNMKDILKRNIKQESPRKFIADQSMTLYVANKQIGTLLVSKDDKPYVNFRSDSLNFTFPLTYGIGMFLGELTSENSR